MTTQSPDDGPGVPTPRDPPAATPGAPGGPDPVQIRATQAAQATEAAQAAPTPQPAAQPAPPAPTPDPTVDAEFRPAVQPGRPPGQDLGMAPMDKSAGPHVVPPAQTNAATADLSRAETRPAGRAAPEPDAADEPGGGGDPGDVHPKVAEYEAELAADEKEPNP